MTLLALVALPGCSSTHWVSLESARPASVRTVEGLNRRAQAQPAQVTLTTGQWRQVHGLRMAIDSTSWIANGQPETVATSTIHSVEFHDSLRGGLVGAGIGVSVGVPLVIMGLQDVFSGPDARYYTGLVLMPLSALVGFGAGYRHVYRLQH